MLPVPMLSTTRALHIESEQHYLFCPERRGEVNRLIPGVPAAVYRVGLAAEALTCSAPNPVRTELVARHLADAPHLALKAREDLRLVDLPEPVVRSVEQVRPRRKLERRVDDDQLSLAANEL